MNCDWLKETFWQYDVSVPGLDIQYNVLKCEEVIRMKLILKFHKDYNLAGRFLIYTFIFLVYIFAIIFGGKPKDSLMSARTD